MKAQTVQRSVPAALLTFSVMLLVLAIGFVLGRVVVARAYMGAAPKIEAGGSAGSELDGDRSPPGRIYVPSPSASPPPDDADARAQRGQRSPGQETTEAEPAPEGAASTSDAGRPTQAEQAPVAAPAEEPQPAEETKGKSYSIQVGVFSSLQGAREVVGDLARAGYPARISPDKRGAEALYRVLTGRYRSEYAARKAMEQLRAEGFEAFLMEQ